MHGFFLKQAMSTKMPRWRSGASRSLPIPAPTSNKDHQPREPVGVKKRLVYKGLPMAANRHQAESTDSISVGATTLVMQSLSKHACLRGFFICDVAVVGRLGPLFVQVAIGSLMMRGYAHRIASSGETSAMFRDLTIIIGLVFVGFMMGVLFHVKNPDCAIQRLTPTTKAGATTHQYRRTPYAIPN